MNHSADPLQWRLRIGEATAILLNKIRLIAIVGGNEAINPFVVTEVYVHKRGAGCIRSRTTPRRRTFGGHPTG